MASENNHALIYILLAFIGVLLVALMSTLYSTGVTIRELITDFSEQTERTLADIRDRVSNIQQKVLGTEEEDRKQVVITNVIIMDCDQSETDCKVISSDADHREVQKEENHSKQGKKGIPELNPNTS